MFWQKPQSQKPYPFSALGKQPFLLSAKLSEKCKTPFAHIELFQNTKEKCLPLYLQLLQTTNVTQRSRTTTN
jgi:hypothetical protein